MGGGLHGRSGSVALPRVKVVLAGLAWERARKAERAVEGRRRVFDIMGYSMEDFDRIRFIYQDQLTPVEDSLSGAREELLRTVSQRCCDVTRAWAVKYVRSFCFLPFNRIQYEERIIFETEHLQLQL